MEVNGKTCRVPFGVGLHRFRKNYVRCFSREHYDTLIRTVLSSKDSTNVFRSSLMRGSLHNLIGCLFIWSRTPQGNDYWHRIYYEWYRYLRFHQQERE